MASSPHFVRAHEDTHPRLVEAAFAKAKLEQEGKPAPHPFIDGFNTMPVDVQTTMYGGERYVSLANALAFLGISASHFCVRSRSRKVYLRSIASPHRSPGQGRKARFYNENDLIFFKEYFTAPKYLPGFNIPGRRSRLWRNPPTKQEA